MRRTVRENGMSEKKAQQSFLEGDEGAAQPAEAPALGAPPRVGLLVTNHLNLLYMLAAGLLMPPSGFGGKHYRDALAAYPGWLPLFIGHGRRLPRARPAAINEATSEAKHLRPVLVEVDLRGLSGPVHVVGERGWAERRIEEGVAADEGLLCVPAPLPIDRVRTILFRVREHLRATKDDAAERSNVPLADFVCKTASHRFAGSEQSWPPPDGPAERAVALAPAQAAGGVMGVLHAMANGGELAAAVCRVAFEPDAVPAADVGPAGEEDGDDRQSAENHGSRRVEVLVPLAEWMRTGSPGRPDASSRGLFWGAVDCIVKCRSTASGGDRPEDALVAYLRTSAERMENEQRQRAEDLVETLGALGGGFGGGSPSQMLRRHAKALPRALVLFYLRRKSGELMDLVESYPQLSDGDKLAAAVLFGARDGWLGLPVGMRGIPELGRAVTHRMAALAHRLDESGFDLGEAPPRVRPLRELFGDSAQWDVKTEKAAVRLARGLKWNCIRTTVSLGRGRYQFRIEGGSAHIDFEGEPKVITRVDRDRFLEALAGERIDSRVDQAVRRDLGG